MKMPRSRPLILLGIGMIVAALGAGLLLRQRVPRAVTPDLAVTKSQLPSSQPSRAENLAPSPVSPTKPSVGQTSEELEKQIAAALASREATDWEWVLNVLFPALLAKDRVAAARFVAGLEPGDAREQLLRRLARAWAAADFAEALTWIATLPEITDRKAAFEDACFQVAETDPADAIHAWQKLEFTADDHVLENLVQNWAAKDLPAAQAWLSAQPSSKFRDQALARVAYVMAATKPSEAASLVMTQLPTGPAQTEAAMSVLSQWARKDIAGASAWVQRLPPGDLAERAQAELRGLRPQDVSLQK